MYYLFPWVTPFLNTPIKQPDSVLYTDRDFSLSLYMSGGLSFTSSFSLFYFYVALTFTIEIKTNFLSLRDVIVVIMSISKAFLFFLHFILAGIALEFIS